MRQLMYLRSLLGAGTLVASLCVALCMPVAAAWQGYARAVVELAAFETIDASQPMSPRLAPAAGAVEVDPSIRWEIVDSGGRSLARNDVSLAWPVIARQTTLPLPMHGMVELRVAKSLRALVADVGLLILMSSAVGLAIGLFMRRVVLRLLDRILSEQRAENLRFTTAIENISQGLCFFDGNHRLIVANRRYGEMYGLSDDLVKPGTMLRDIVDARFASGAFPAMDRESYLAWRENIAVTNRPSDTQLALRNGKTFAIHHEPMPDGGWVATHEDITDRTEALAQIERMAHHDSLTGLPNRVLFRERLNTAIREASPGMSIAVLYIDLDRFKVVNDTLGHPVGDELLRLVAERLDDCVRENDLLARLGGDEFAIIQMGVAQPAAAQALASRLVQVIERPFDVKGHRLLAATSVGVALWPDDGLDGDQLLSQADLALYDAKAAGRGAYRFFHSQMREKANSRRALEIDLRRAVSLGQLELHYQPIVSLRHPSGRSQRQVAAFEALLRWRHPELGMVMPDLFIGLAEETGLIESIGEWVLEQAMIDAVEWPNDIGVAINLSPAVEGRTARRRGPESVAAFGSRTRARGARDHRVGAARGELDQRRAAARVARHRREDFARRLRDRLFVAELSAFVPVQEDQDRSFVRARRGRQQGGGRDRQRHRHVGRHARHGRDRRGGRDRRAARLADAAALPAGARLSVQQAATGERRARHAQHRSAAGTGRLIDCGPASACDTTTMTSSSERCRRCSVKVTRCISRTRSVAPSGPSTT